MRQRKCLRGEGFKSLAYGPFRGEQENLIIRNKFDYANALQKAGVPAGKEDIDFSQNIILAVFDGVIKWVKDDGDVVQAGIYRMNKSLLPKWAADKQDYHIVKIPFTSLPIEFIEAGAFVGDSFTPMQETIDKLKKQLQEQTQKGQKSL